MTANGTISFTGGDAYDYPMMTFDGSTGYYTGTATYSGNLTTSLLRFNVSSFAGSGVAPRLMYVQGSGGIRSLIIMYSSDYATATRRNKLSMICQTSTGSTICRVFSTVDVNDGNDHIVLAAFDSTTGVASMIIDGADDLDTGNAEHTLATGTLAQGAGQAIAIGADTAPANFVGGEIGYCGYANTYLTNGSDFMSGSTPKEIDESGWTEWGAQPLFWNKYGTMTDNKGSAGNMTANGTITGPA
jgi:hypothetical protein